MTLSCDLFPEVWRATVHVARKQHRCCECRVPILPGEKYTYCFGVWEGRKDIYKQHDLCATACEYVRDNIQSGNCIPFGSLKEWWGEYKSCVSPMGEHKVREPLKDIRLMLAKIFRRERACKK